MKSIARITLFPFASLAAGLIFSFGQPAQKINVTAYPEHLPGKFTGGFGEQTCHSCHFDYPLNFEEGTLRIDGLPGRYESGKSYTLQISVGRADLSKAGFQLTARFQDGSQAGAFRVRSNRVEFTNLDSAAVQYVQHSAEGTEPADGDRSVWSVEWTAPAEAASEVTVHIAGNAANGDASEFGDYILTREINLKSYDGR